MSKQGFLPEDYLEKRAQRRTNIISLMLFVLVMGGVAGAFFVTDRQCTEIRRLHAQVNVDYQEAAKRLEQMDKLQEQREEAKRKARITASILERIPRSLILAELVNSMPATLALYELDLSTKTTVIRQKANTAIDKAKIAKVENKKKAAEGEPITTYDVTIYMIGVAPTDMQVAQYMTSLSRNPMFKDVNLAFTENNELNNQTVRKFRVEMKLAVDLNMNDLEKTMVKRDLLQNPMSRTIKIDANGQLLIPEDPSTPTKREPTVEVPTNGL